MRNQEAARYARMAAIAAGLIVLLVVIVYTQRAVRRARRAPGASVPSGVEQQSANFTYSDVEQGRTIFTLRASHATQFKKENRALLDDVWITIYGREGNRNDNIHTRQCSYEPESEGIRCQGEVQIDLQGAMTPDGKAPADAISRAMHVKTSDLTFNRESGEASTDAPVEFSFAQGQGRGTGVRYSTHDSTLRIDHDVEFALTPSDRSGGMPVKVTGSSMEVQRDKLTATLSGPATVQQGGRELDAGKISILFDQDFHAQQAVAEDQPSIRGNENGAKFSLSATTFTASLDPQGTITRLLSQGSVAGTRQAPAGTDRFMAERVEFAMIPGSNAVREMNASGAVVAEAHQGADLRTLKTEALKVNFKPPVSPGKQKNPAGSSLDAAGAQRIETAETLAPGTIDSKTGNENTRLSAKRFVAQFGATGRIEKLFGHGDVEVRRQIAGNTPQTSSATELVATFAPTGDWDSIEESGHVRLSEADRQASAAKVSMIRSSGLATLEGSPVISDSQSRTTAGAVSINQQTGEIHATGGIVSTYVASSTASNDAMNLGSGPAHISADKLVGLSTSGHVTYSGHARLWQGQSVLQAEQIDIWRNDKKLEAHGHVVVVFPQAAGSDPSFGLAPAKAPAPATARPSAPAQATLWLIHAPALTYWSDQGKAHLEGGVTASSDQGSLDSRTLDVFLTSPPEQKATSVKSSTSGEGAGKESAGKELNRILAQGGVTVRQGERQGSAEQAEYTAADQKFVLSGGEPAIHDASSDTTTTGHSLTFYVASDTILIDSQEGLRTLTKHRVEK
ncbi:MAG TPA: LPS export ABC transporter periplasmic protein LptC [Candidatus Acidoferrales bacterium]|nr:LPS export ABC transporter periplasmic protein LptC [Candidatus Acidoferrales bacterium]